MNIGAVNVFHKSEDLLFSYDSNQNSVFPILKICLSQKSMILGFEILRSPRFLSVFADISVPFLNWESDAVLSIRGYFHLLNFLTKICSEIEVAIHFQGVS